MIERNVKVLSLCLSIKHFTGEHLLVRERIYYSLPLVVLEAKAVSELRLAHCKLEPCNQFNSFHLKSLNLDDVSLYEQVIQNLTLSCPLIKDFQLYNYQAPNSKGCKAWEKNHQERDCGSFCLYIYIFFFIPHDKNI